MISEKTRRFLGGARNLAMFALVAHIYLAPVLWPLAIWKVVEVLT